MDTKEISVMQNDSRRKTIEVSNIRPITNIKVMRDHESSIGSDSELSDVSSVSTVKKTKKILRKKVHQSHSQPSPEQMNYSAFINKSKTKPPREDSASDSNSEYSDSEDSDSASDSNSEYSQFEGNQPQEQDPKKTWEDKQRMKQELLIKIQALQQKGFEFSKKFTMTSNYEDMLFEYEKIKKHIESQAAVKMARRCLMACVTGLEFLNKKFDPFNLKLDGWSETVMENVDDYDNIFEKLHEKYSSSVAVAPEIELLLTLGGSAFMFHLTNTMLKGPAMASISTIGQNNPNFMANMMSAMSQGMKASAQQPFAQQPMQQHRGPPQAMETRATKSEMSGPRIDPSLFAGTSIANNYPSAPMPMGGVGGTDIRNYRQRDEDVYSIASSDTTDSSDSFSDSSSESSKQAKKVLIKRNTGKKQGGLELNIS
jgi:hypothetical protein